jgi:hypothetical protein
MHASFGRMPEKRRKLLLGLFIVMHVRLIDLALERLNFYPRSPSVSVRFDLHTGGALRECVDNDSIDIDHVSTQNQLADILTKALGKVRFIELRQSHRCAAGLSISKRICISLYIVKFDRTTSEKRSPTASSSPSLK